MSETEGLPTEPMEPEPGTEPDAPSEPEPAAEPEPDADETPEGEPPANPAEGEEAEPAPPALDEKEIERVYKALGKLRETTANRVSAIMGDDAIALQPCPVCGEDIPGQVWQVPFEDSIEPIYANVRAWLGLSAPVKLKRHEGFQMCTDCDGAGFIDTGSKRDNYREATCPRCVGKGYLSGLEIGKPAAAADAEPREAWTVPEPANGHELPPEAQALRDQGWMVAPPITFDHVGS